MAVLRFMSFSRCHIDQPRDFVFIAQVPGIVAWADYPSRGRCWQSQRAIVFPRGFTPTPNPSRKGEGDLAA